MKLVSYFGDWRDEQWQCEHCEWCGKGSELADGEMFSEVMEMDCVFGSAVGHYPIVTA